MQLDWLEILGFRSYESFRFEPDPGTNVLIGPNGAGKTNILEAIGYLSALKSFRGSPDTSLIAVGSSQAVIRGSFRDERDLEATVEISLPTTSRRTILLNGKRPRRNADVAAAVPMVTFLPDDLDLVKGGPGRRRDYFDDLVSALTPVAGGDASEYERAVRQRNALLRADGGYVDRGSLDALDDQVARLGAVVLGNRLGLVKAMTEGLGSIYRRIAVSEAAVRWVYRASWHEPWGLEIDPATDEATLATRMTESLALRRDRDLHQRTTTTGPHRDDPCLMLDGRDVRTQASQGEQRSCALALRVIAYRLLKDRHNTAPILLLDDVFSELDPRRSDGVVELLPAGQVFVTSARHDEVPLTGLRWDVGGGAVTNHERGVGGIDDDRSETDGGSHNG